MGEVSSNPAPSCCHASAAAISDSAPGPEWISAEVTSGGSDMKSMTVTLTPLRKAKQIRADETGNRPQTLHVDAFACDLDSLPMTLASGVTVGSLSWSDGGRGPRRSSMIRS